MVEKIYYSMGEITEMLDVEPTAIRYWCSQFSCLRPKRNAKGNRMFTKQDVERLKRIHHLLKEKKMTIEGAQKAMRKNATIAEGEDTDMALLEQLQTLRAMLLEMREGLGEEDLAEEAVPAATTPVAEAPAAETPAEQVAEVEQAEPVQKKKRAPRRKLIGEEGVVERPLFPFYEQTLF